MSKIGIGLITCNRNEFLANCVKSIRPEWYDEIIIVNDGEKPITTFYECNIINNEKNVGVGKTKNIALKYLIDKECDHLFLVEDDIIFKENAFKKYIEVSEKTNIKHLNYCLHGHDNKKDGDIPNPRKIIEYNDTKIALYNNVYGACSYYHKSVIDDIGLIDEEYYNAMEHVDHTMMAINKNYHPPVRWFADIVNSNEYIVDQDVNHSKSTIRKGNWLTHFKAGVDRFNSKFNIDVTNPHESVCDLQTVISKLKEIKSQ